MIGRNSSSRALCGTKRGAGGVSKPLACRWHRQQWLSAQALPRYMALLLTGQLEHPRGRQAQTYSSRLLAGELLSLPFVLGTLLPHSSMQKLENGNCRWEHRWTVANAVVRDNPQNVDDPQVCIHVVTQQCRVVIQVTHCLMRSADAMWADVATCASAGDALAELQRS